MLPEEELKRTARQMTLIGPHAQETLHNARVLVIGAGGLGCPVMQSLAATGIGHVEVWDDDTVALSNIHRQILFLSLIHISEPTRLLSISYAVFCLKKKTV